LVSPPAGSPVVPWTALAVPVEGLAWLVGACRALSRPAHRGGLGGGMEPTPAGAADHDANHNAMAQHGAGQPTDASGRLLCLGFKAGSRRCRRCKGVLTRVADADKDCCRLPRAPLPFFALSCAFPTCPCPAGSLGRHLLDGDSSQPASTSSVDTLTATTGGEWVPLLCTEWRRSQVQAGDGQGQVPSRLAWSAAGRFCASTLDGWPSFPRCLLFSHPAKDQTACLATNPTSWLASTHIYCHSLLRRCLGTGRRLGEGC